MIVPESLITSIAKAAGRALLPKVRDGLIGPPEERRLDSVCQKTLHDVIESYGDAGVSNDDLVHVLEIIELTLQAQGLDGQHLLSMSVEGADGFSWRTAIEDAGYEPDELALPVEQIMRRFVEEIPARLRREAASPGSPLFQLLTVKMLTQLTERLSDDEARLAATVPVQIALRVKLEAMQEMCRVIDQPFRMPHMMLVLLEDDLCKQRVDLVRPELSAMLIQRLSLFVHGSRLADDHYVDSDWTQRTEVRHARIAAFREQEPFVSSVRLLYAALMTESGTISELRALLGVNFFWLLDVLAEPAPTTASGPTPGPILGSL